MRNPGYFHAEVNGVCRDLGEVVVNEFKESSLRSVNYKSTLLLSKESFSAEFSSLERTGFQQTNGSGEWRGVER